VALEVDTCLIGVTFEFAADGRAMFADCSCNLGTGIFARFQRSDYGAVRKRNLRIPGPHYLSVLHLAYSNSGMCGNLGYTGRMSRSAIIQARVCPEIKLAGEQVLRSIGLTMTEAMELFLRRLIVDQKMPFEVIALDGATFAMVMESWESSRREDSIDLEVRHPLRSRRRQKKE
jgi:addiction module RelB/DinJ family antitoxin